MVPERFKTRQHFHLLAGIHSTGLLYPKQEIGQSSPWWALPSTIEYSLADSMGNLMLHRSNGLWIYGTIAIVQQMFQNESFYYIWLLNA